MEHTLAGLLGVAAAGAGLYSAFAKSLIALRVAAVIASGLAMICALLLGAHLAAAFAGALLALHGWRLATTLKLIRDIDVAIAGDMNVDWLLPYTRPAHFKAGDVLMKRGEYATAAFYIVAGEVAADEIGQTFGKGTLLGEIGLFTPDGRRMMTVRCKTDVHAATIDYDQFKELYFENPQFGFRLLHLVVARLQSRIAVPPAAT